MRIFINYRSSDSATTASALFRDLERRLGRESVFIDHGRIEGGERWPNRLRQEVEKATAMLCLIGPDWLEHGAGERLRNPEDWVRLEIARALERGIDMIPVRVDGARLPVASMLPEELRPLLDRQSRPLRRFDWDRDVDLLVRDLGITEQSTNDRSNRPISAGGLTGLLSRRKEIRVYLKRLIGRMHLRNAAIFSASDANVDPYIDPAADERGTKSAKPADYPRQRGYVLASARIRPAVTEVTAASAPLEGVTTSSDLVGLKSRRVPSVLKALNSASQPLVLLGEPGSGKSTTLRELAIRLAERALVLPNAPIPIYLELGAFRQPLGRDANAVILDFIRSAIPPALRHLRSDLITSGSRQLVVLFDAMDEMPRAGDYSARTAALAGFATDYFLVMRSVFACRTNDFDPGFGHRQLILKPFDERRIRELLSRTIGRRFLVENETQTPKSAARKLMRADELGSEAGNPLTLSLAADFIRQKRRWPRGRISLFEDHVVALADRALQRRDQRPSEELIQQTVAAWAGVAYAIFRRQGAVTIPGDELRSLVDEEAILLARSGGLVIEDSVARELKFRHHRLQEFLVAYRLRLPDPPRPDWAAILVSPRWQETLLNYFSLGGQDQRALEVVLGTLDDPGRFFSRLLPIVNRVHDRVRQRRKEVDAIKPDETRAAGQGTIRVYSKAQRARKDAAERRFRRANYRLTRLRSLPPLREVNWSDQIQFAARLGARLESSDPGLEKLRQLLRATVEGMLELGRPPAQVRMLSIWGLLSGWCPPSLLDRVRDSPVDWVRAQAIHALISTDLDRDRIDHAFSEELEWETLNLRLPSKIALFKESATLRAGRKWKLGLALLSHLAHWLVVLTAIFTTASFAPEGLVALWQPFADLSSNSSMANWFGWFALVAMVSVLTVPAFSWPLSMRLAAVNAGLGGLVLAVGSLARHSNATTEITWKSWAPLADRFIVLAWFLAPAVATTIAVLSLLGLTSLILRGKGGRSDDELRGFERAAGSSSALILGWISMAAAGLGTVLSLLVSPVGVTLWIVGMGIVGLALVFWLLSVVAGTFMESWQKFDSLAAPMRLVRIAREAATSTLGCLAFLIFMLVLMSLPVGLFFLIQMGFVAIVPQPVRDGLGYTFGIAALGLPIGLLAIWILFYIFGAWHQALSELRYRVLRGRLRKRDYRGTLRQWQSEFEKASEIRRRELLETLDHRAMGVSAEEALDVLYRVETLVDREKPVASLFYQAMHGLREAARQQRWTAPAD